MCPRPFGPRRDLNNTFYHDFCNQKLLQFTCNFVGEGITRFDHDKMNEEIIPNCETEDCFSLGIVYKDSLDLIDLVKEKSSSCQQRIKVCMNKI